MIVQRGKHTTHNEGSKQQQKQTRIKASEQAVRQGSKTNQPGQNMNMPAGLTLAAAAQGTTAAGAPAGAPR